MTTPSGSISLAQQNLKVSLADCTAFRTWCGASDQAAALARIHLEGLPDPPEGQQTYTAEQLRALRPYAIVNTKPAGGFSLALAAFGAHGDYDAAGKLEVQIFQNCPATLDNDPSSDANLQFANFCAR